MQTNGCIALITSRNYITQFDKVIKVINKVIWQLAKLQFAALSGTNYHFFNQSIHNSRSINHFFNQDNWKGNLTTCKMTICNSQRCSVSRILKFQGKIRTATTSISNFFDLQYIFHHNICLTILPIYYHLINRSNFEALNQLKTIQ